MNKSQKRYYLHNLNRIEKELGIKFKGDTEEDLVAFVKAHIRDLPNDYEEDNRIRYRKPLKSASYTPSGMFRKHGEKSFKGNDDNKPMQHIKGSSAVNHRRNKPSKVSEEKYEYTIFKNEADYNKALRLAGRIERELGIVYTGTTESALISFVGDNKHLLNRREN